MTTDSFGALQGITGGLGLIPGTACPHYDGEPERRAAYHALIGSGAPAGYAAEDGAALHFVGTGLAEVVSSRPGARAYRVERGADGVVETPLTARYLGA